MSLEHFWRLLTRLGEAQILLPVALLTVLALWRTPGARPFAARWGAWLIASVIATLATKVAFVGWGIGWPSINFTGIAGHALLATAVYPVLFATLASSQSRLKRNLAIGAGCVLALLICVSRVLLGAHTPPEVLAGMLIGGLVAGFSLAVERRSSGAVSPAIPVLLVAWLVLMPIHAPSSRTYSTVTKLALYLSGHETPYTRSRMLRDFRRQQSAHAVVSTLLW